MSGRPVNFVTKSGWAESWVCIHKVHLPLGPKHLTKVSSYAVATGFLDQTRPDGGDYRHTKFSLSYLMDKPGPGQLFLAM